MSDILYQFFGVAIVLLLMVQTLILLFRSGQTPDSEQRRQHAIAESPPAEIFPGIPVAEHATVAEQHDFLERLARLPQIRRLPDGSLVDWLSGFHIEPCDCRQGKDHPHLQLAWMGEKGLRMVSRTGLAHYLSYQERVAQLLAGKTTVEGDAP